MAGNKKVSSPIVYYGGKTSLLSHILPLIPEHKVYTEVFFGGGAVFFAKPKVKNETINDRLDLVINFYRVLKSNFAELKLLIDSTLIGRSIHKEALQIIRNKSSRTNKIKLAWAFWVCTNFAYSNKIGGGYKYSNSMTVAVPDTLQSRKKLFNQWLVKRIEHAYIENEDALKILESRNVENAFHYLDPPYVEADQGHYKGYTQDNFNDLLTWCACKCKGKFLLSHFENAELRKTIMNNNWNFKEIEFRIKAPSKQIRVKTELLIWNYDLLPSLFNQ